jgi:hypothetical protein
VLPGINPHRPPRRHPQLGDRFSLGAAGSRCSASARTAASASGASTSAGLRACGHEIEAFSSASRAPGSRSTSVPDSASSADAAGADSPKVTITSSTAHSLTPVSTAGRAAREATAAAPTS